MNDLELAKESSKKYKQFKSDTQKNDPVDFDIKILTTSYWPSYKTFELSVPVEIKSCMDNFTAYYNKLP